jgi:predicted ABC-type ATPase
MTEGLKPRLIVVAGPNGSGKTTITDKLLRHEWMEGCVYINPDQIAQIEFGDWNRPENVLKAVQRAQEMREACLSSGTSLAFETVFSAPDKVDFLHRARTAGFFVRLFFICTDDPTINAQRVALRVMEGGHDVPIAKIISRYYRSLANCVVVVPWIDRAYLYDNSVTDADPRLMFRVMEGRIAKSYGAMAPWAEKVANTLLTSRR